MLKIANGIYIKSERTFQHTGSIQKIKIVLGQILLTFGLIPFHMGYCNYKNYGSQADPSLILSHING